MASQQEIDNWYTYHPPTGAQIGKYHQIREKAKEFAELFESLTENSADKSDAHRQLRKTVAAMNAAVACSG